MKYFTTFALAVVLIFSTARSHAQTIYSLAGDTNLVPGYSGDNGQALNAELNNPISVASDAYGDIFICDNGNNVIREVDEFGFITTVAGNRFSSYGGDGGQATNAQLSEPNGVAIDGNMNLYIADTYNNVIRKVDNTGIISTVAGNYSKGGGFSGDGGPATAAQLYSPMGVAVDANGNLYISDAGNNVIRKVDGSGTITTVAGSNAIGGSYSGDGGPATAAGLSYPNCVAFDDTGLMYIADSYNDAVRKVDSKGNIHTFAGGGYTSSGNCGYATNAFLSTPISLAFDDSDNLYITEQTDNDIREVNVAGTITTAVGQFGTGGFGGNGGPPDNAKLLYPGGICFDPYGDLFIADEENQIIREVVYVNTNRGIFAGPAIHHSAKFCSNTYQTFSVTPVAGATYSWTVPNDWYYTSYLPNTDSVVAYIYDFSGTVTVTEHLCGTSKPTTLNVTIIPSPYMGGVYYNKPDVCNHDSIILSVTAGLTYAWSPAAGLSNTTDDSVKAYPPASTTYSVTGTAANGCTASDTFHINVVQPPVVSFTGLTPYDCLNAAPVVLTGGSPANGFYTGPGVVNDTFYAAKAGAGGPYSINYIYYSSQFCYGSAGEPATVYPLPNVTVTPDSVLQCGPMPVSVSAGGATTYTWSPSLGLSNTTGDTVTANPGINATYMVTGTDTTTCSNTASLVITVDAMPTLTVSNDTTISVGNAVQLFSQANYSVTWSPADSLSCTACNNPIATPIVTTAYIATVTIGSCIVSDTVLITVDNTTGSKQLPANNYRLFVYPNPASNTLHTGIILAQTSDLQLQLINVLGQTVWSIDAGNVSHYTANIPVTGIAEGVYMLQAKVKGGATMVTKVAVTR